MALPGRPSSSRPPLATAHRTTRRPLRGRVRADVGLSEPSPSEAVRKRYPCGPRCGRATGFLNRGWRSGFADSNPLGLDSNPLGLDHVQARRNDL
jgi:hypothetical protein